MTRRVSAREARQHFAELTDRVCYTGEAVVIEKQGRPCVAVISMEDFALLPQVREEERLRQEEERLRQEEEYEGRIVHAVKEFIAGLELESDGRPASRGQPQLWDDEGIDA
jgi:prevent-host-death family protein